MVLFYGDKIEILSSYTTCKLILLPPINHEATELSYPYAVFLQLLYKAC